jgi:hypothetical protein
MLLYWGKNMLHQQKHPPALAQSTAKSKEITEKDRISKKEIEQGLDVLIKRHKPAIKELARR